MANKSVKKSPSGKRPAPKGPMSVNKSSTPAWMRMVIIVVAVSFIAGGIGISAIVLGGGGKSTSTGATGDTITATYQPRVESAKAAMETSPENPDVVAQVGHAYFDWAVALYEGGQQSASVPIWKSAVSYYDQALALRPDDDIVLGNKAFALYYAGDPLAKSAIEAFIASAADNADLAQQVQQAQSYLTELESTPATTTP
jgi:hypothetical protein